MNLSDFENITKEPIAQFILDLLFIIGGGILAIFYFDRNLFLTLDAVRLILLAIAVTIPFITLGSVIFVPVLNSTFQAFSAGIFIAGTSFVSSLFFNYLFGSHRATSLRSTILLTIFFEILTIVLIFNERKKNKFSKN